MDLNAVKTQEEWRTLANKSAEMGVPKGYVYVGLGAEGRHGLGFGSCLKVSFRKKNWTEDVRDKYVGSTTTSHYACPVKIWEEKTGLKFMNTFEEEFKVAAQKYWSLRSRIDETFKAANELKGQKVILKIDNDICCGILSSVNVFTQNPPNERFASCLVEDFYEKAGYVIVVKIDHYSLPLPAGKKLEVFRYPEIQLNYEHSATIREEDIKVGCQSFSHDVIFKLADEIKKFNERSK
jgi:hypothetical protein